MELSNKTIIRVLGSVIAREKDFLSGILNTYNKIPNYSSSCKKCAKICTLNIEECKKFYKEFETSSESDRYCPFGFLVKKSQIEGYSSNETLSIYTLTDFDESKSYHDRNIISTFPRSKKKELKEGLDERASITISPESRSKHEMLKNLLTAILLGRLSFFMQGLVHQLFTPIQGALSDLENIKENQNTANSIERLSENLSSINGLSQQIQLLLSTSPEFSYNMLRKVKVHTMVDNIIKQVVNIATEKHINIRHNYNRYSKLVDAIPNQLYLVLSNIIQNAVKYSYKGFPDKNFDVEISYDIDGNFLIIIVSNTGCQISEEEIHNGDIFTLGYRGVNSNDRNRTGTGVGLYISDILVKLHGGRIHVDSNPVHYNTNNGGNVPYLTTFKIYWPIYIDPV